MGKDFGRRGAPEIAFCDYCFCGRGGVGGGSRLGLGQERAGRDVLGEVLD